MAHTYQQDFCRKMKSLFPEFFNGKRILDIGSLDVNGNNRFLFDDQSGYIGLDVGEGPNVDVSTPGHVYDAPDDFFDIIISTEVFEHDMYYKDTIKNIIRMLKPGGTFIFTCASGQRPEHGTRRRGEDNAPLLIQQSEEWADYYKNLEEDHFVEIDGFKQAFPDGIFELGCYGEFNHEWTDPAMHNIHADIYFFGVKGGISNAQRYAPRSPQAIINSGEYAKDIFVIDAWPDKVEKESDLLECIGKLREFTGIPILLVSHYAIKPEIQKLVDYYIFDKDNPLLIESEFEDYQISPNRWCRIGEDCIDNSVSFHHDYAIWQSMRHAFAFCKHLGKETIHFMEYDNLIDTFQYRQTFLEQAHSHDAVIYEYTTGSSQDTHLSPYMSTFIFSINTDIALKVIGEVNSKKEYFANRTKGYQLERVFLHYLTKHTSNIKVSDYIANDDELNTQAVWNRDGILRDDARFQIYVGADDFGQLYIHLASGFHEVPADRDYLLEIKYDEKTSFKNLKIGEYFLEKIGEYKRGLTVRVNYLGREVFSEFLSVDYPTFAKMNHVTLGSASESPSVITNFVNGPYAELRTKSIAQYNVEFSDSKTRTVHYSVKLQNGYWGKASTKYYVDWKIKVIDSLGKEVSSADFDLTDKRVYIALDSSSLGDNIAWFPYVEEFRKKHNCEMICSTFWNSLFEKNYPNIKFVIPGTPVNDLYAMYKVGWFYNSDNTIDLFSNPSDFKLGPLQKTSSDILDLDFKEIKPIVSYPKKKRLKKVGLGINSTAQAKYWNNPTGWQEVTDWLIANGYEPVILSREEDGYMGNPYPVGASKLPAGPIDKAIAELAECQAFIGISSGLTWLAWVTDTPTIQISGFTEPFNEPNEGIVKISAPAGACSGCANRLRLDAGDWNWCPDQKGTPRQFECSKLITAEQVINELKKILV